MHEARMQEFSTICTTLGALVLLLSLFSVPIGKSLLFSKPIIALIIGFLIGPLGWNWIRPNAWILDPSLLLELAAKLTIGLTLMAAALRISPGFIAGNMKNLSLILGPVMLLMWLSSALVIGAFTDLPLWALLLAAATLTPTDPVLSAAIVEGPLARKILPRRLREMLSAESGLNDGLAYPLVMLPLAMAGAGPLKFSWEHWFLNESLWNIGGGLVMGWLTGLALGKIFLFAELHDYVDEEALFGSTVALTLLLIGAAEFLRINGLLAIFLAGRGFNHCVKKDAASREVIIQNATNQLFSVPIFTLFGILAPVDSWLHLGWRGCLLALSIVLLRRLPWFLILRSRIPVIRTWHDAWVLGWFGPMGAAALFYASEAARHTGVQEIWTIGSLVVATSILIHGLSTTPLSRAFAFQQSKHDHDQT